MLGATKKLMDSKSSKGFRDFFNIYAIKLVLLIVFICSVYISLLGIYFVRSNLTNIRGMEPSVIFSIQKVMSGNPLYTHPEEIPFDITQYSPCYYYICAGVASAIHVVPGELHQVYIIARSLSFLFNLLWLFFCYRIMTELLAVSRKYSLVATGFIYIFSCPWNFLARPDALNSLFTIAAIYYFYKSLGSNVQKSHRVILIGVAALLGVAAGFTKQNGFQMPLIFLSFLLLNKQWKKFGVALNAAIVPLILVLIFSESLFGPALKENIVDGVKNGLAPGFTLSHIYLAFLFRAGIILILAGLVFWCWTRPAASLRERFLAYLMWAQFLVATVTALKKGAAIHYYNDFLATAVICVVYFLSGKNYWKMFKPLEMQKNKVLALIFLYVMVSCGLVTRLQIKNYFHYIRYTDQALAERQEIIKFLKSEFKAHPGSFFLCWDHYINNSLPKQCALPQKDLAEISYRKNLFNYFKYYEAIKTGKIRYIIYGDGKMPSSFMSVSFENYSPLKILENFSVYVWHG